MGGTFQGSNKLRFKSVTRLIIDPQDLTISIKPMFKSKPKAKAKFVGSGWAYLSKK